MQHDDRFDEGRNPYASPFSTSDEALPSIIDEGEFKPFRTIWTRPRQTVRQIIAVNPELHVLLLVCLTGIGRALDRASMRNVGDVLPMAAIVGIACVFGPLVGLVGLWIGSHLIRLSGTWIGGIASREHIKTAIAWASVPSVFALLLWIPQILLFGSDMFTEETPRLNSQPALLIPFFGIVLADLILAVWGFVLLCNTVAEVQGFRSAWRGLGNIMLAGAVVVIPLVAVVLAIVFVVFLASQA